MPPTGVTQPIMPGGPDRPGAADGGPVALLAGERQLPASTGQIWILRRPDLQRPGERADDVSSKRYDAGPHGRPDHWSRRRPGGQSRDVGRGGGVGGSGPDGVSGLRDLGRCERCPRPALSRFEHWRELPQRLRHAPKPFPDRDQVIGHPADPGLEGERRRTLPVVGAATDAPQGIDLLPHLLGCLLMACGQPAEG